MKQHDFLVFLVFQLVFTVHFEIIVLPYSEQHRRQIFQWHVLCRTHDTTTDFPCPQLTFKSITLGKPEFQQFRTTVEIMMKTESQREFIYYYRLLFTFRSITAVLIVSIGTPFVPFKSTQKKLLFSAFFSNLAPNVS